MSAQETNEVALPVVQLEVSGKKEKKYSKRLKDLQKGRERGAKALFKIANAVAVGIDKYRSESDKSARKKKDGAARDFVPNVADGIGKAIRVGSKAATDIGRIWNTKRRRKRTKKVLRNLNRFRIWR